MAAHLRGIIACVAAALFFATQDAITKHLTASVPIPQIVLVRFTVLALFAAVYAHRRIGIRRALSTRHLWLHVIRGLIIVLEIGLFALTLVYLGIAETHAVFACFPLIVAALSQPLLGERVGWRRWTAIATGFIGTLIVLRPGVDAFEPAALLALSAAFLFALYNIITRRAAREDQFETSLLYFGAVGLAISAVAGVLYWQPLSISASGWLTLLALTGVCGHWLLIKALQLTPAVVLQPFNYFLLVWAIVVGYLVYGEKLDGSTLMGSALVVGSGIFIAWRERSRDPPSTGSRSEA